MIGTALPLEPRLRVLRYGTQSLLFAPRSLWVNAGLIMLLLLGAMLALRLGHTTLSWHELSAVITGKSSPSTLLLLEFRLPRIVVALLAGAALGLAGHLLQMLTRNRLASPDWLGIPDGVTFSLLLALVLSPDGMLGPWWVGPAGAFLAAVLLWVCAGKSGRRGQTILIVGMGLAALLRAGTELLLAQQALMHASALYSWSLGSLSSRGLPVLLPLAFGLALLLPLTLLCRRGLHLLAFSPDLAATLGLSVRKVQGMALALAVMLAGLAVGVCGPIAFVALAAPIMAQQLAGSGRQPLVGSALLGSTLVLLADTLGRTILAETELPAGVVCNILGGPFLLWLLLSSRHSSES